MQLLISAKPAKAAVAKMCGGGGSIRCVKKTRLAHSYEDIISIENLLCAWKDFVCGKRSKSDVQHFQLRLMDNILSLHRDLKNKVYHHGSYHAFKINDPKPRDIHKASVRDRLLHHALYRKLYPFFNRMFIADSYSCRVGKGTHRALNRFRAYAYTVSRNHTRNCWVLKCDVKKFFASVDHQILREILASRIQDRALLALVGEVIQSHSPGLPLGNLTSQLLVNIYMNEFDQYCKHKLKVKWYIRYADDFVILSHNRAWLVALIPRIQQFLALKLKLTLHPRKVSIHTFASGVDFLGWVHFRDHRVLRSSTRRRAVRNCLTREEEDAVVRAYKGLLQHGNTYKIQTQLP